jgi:hypothetical protein
MPNANKIIESLLEHNSEALTFDGFDEAIVGMVQQSNNKALVAYDYNKCIKVLKKAGMSHQEAVEHISVNMQPAWFGDNTPVILYRG